MVRTDRQREFPPRAGHAGGALEEGLAKRVEPLEGSDYLETYASLADRLAAAAPRFQGFIWDDGGREFLQQTARCMKTWVRAVERIVK